jgi:hypothetical protein
VASDAGLPALQRRFDAIQDLLSGDLTSCGHAVGKGGRTEAKQSARSVTGGDEVLSHFGRRGVRLSYGYDLDQQGRRVTMKLRPPGPWSLVESGAKPHSIPRSTSRRRRRGPRVLSSPSFGPVSGPVEHPGTRGSQALHAVTQTFDRIDRRASKDFHDAYVELLAKVMA